MKPLGALLIFCAQLLPAQPPPGRHLGTITASPEVHVVAFGDWGYRGANSGQAAVAAAVQREHRAEPFDLGLTLGDNFYPSGVRSVNDPLWGTLWEGVYAKLGIPFFATLGNHDYRGNEQAEIDYTGKSKTWRMPARYYTFVAGPVQFFALDTDEGTAGRLLFHTPWSAAQAKWLEAELGRSKARWKVVYGHHPIYSDGFHGDAARLKRKLLPMLKAHGVALYLSGHEHDLEFHQQDGIQFLIVGGGGKDTRGIKARRARFADGRHGFLDLSASAQRLKWHIRSTEGAALQSAILPQPGADAIAPARTRSAPSSRPR